MPYNPDHHHRRSIRLKGYDYSTAGAYFVTMCVHQRRSLLGEIQSGTMYPNAAGEMVQTIWHQLPHHYPGIQLDAFTLMPNHIHGILMLVAPDVSTLATTQQIDVPKLTLGNVVHRFKSLTTAKYRHGVSQLGWEPFDQKLWQRNYYEHIIRSAASLERLQEYIATNPQHWESDQLHPHNPNISNPR